MAKSETLGQVRLAARKLQQDALALADALDRQIANMLRSEWGKDNYQSWFETYGLKGQRDWIVEGEAEAAIGRITKRNRLAHDRKQ